MELYVFKKVEKVEEDEGRWRRWLANWRSWRDEVTGFAVVAAESDYDALILVRQQHPDARNFNVSFELVDQIAGIPARPQILCHELTGCLGLRG